MENLLFASILVPVIAGIAVLPIRRSAGRAKEAIALLATALAVVFAITLFRQEVAFATPWAGFGIEFALRVYQFSAFVLLATAGFGFLVALYCVSFMRDHAKANQFYAYLLFSLAAVNGAVLADNLVVMLFFWEALLGTVFGMIAVGGPDAWKTSTKMFVIVGISDLLMMAGIAITGWIAKANGEAHFLNMSAISGLGLSATGLGGAGMIFLMIGAISKAGSMPFHTWIPDAAIDAPLPFMAFLPASLEKLLGIYFLARVSVDLYHVQPGSWMSWTMMTIGAATILLAVMMALVQTNYKRLLSYHAISQVGYMVLGVGTAIPIGIVGGLFHMINHAMYKSCLFLTGGSVEKQTGTTALEKLGGIAGKMPVTFTCFFIAAAAISGAPPLNGFYSKELVYDAAMERNIFFYLAAVLGTFFTAASFLKLGHAAYFGKRSPEHDNVKEAPIAMLVPMIVIAAGCILFGVYNALPLQNLIEPFIANQLAGETFAGFVPHKMILFVLTLVALGGAIVNHALGVKLGGSGLNAAEHIHHAPGLAWVYRKAQARAFDPYDIGLKVARLFGTVAWAADRAIDWVYNVAAVSLSRWLSLGIRKANTGNYSAYVVWSLAGAAAVILFLIYWR